MVFPDRFQFVPSFRVCVKFSSLSRALQQDKSNDGFFFLPLNENRFYPSALWYRSVQTPNVNLFDSRCYIRHTNTPLLNEMKWASIYSTSSSCSELKQFHVGRNHIHERHKIRTLHHHQNILNPHRQTDFSDNISLMFLFSKNERLFFGKRM